MKSSHLLIAGAAIAAAFLFFKNGISSGAKAIINGVRVSSSVSKNPGDQVLVSISWSYAGPADRVTLSVTAGGTMRASATIPMPATPNLAAQPTYGLYFTVPSDWSGTKVLSVVIFASNNATLATDRSSSVIVSSPTSETASITGISISGQGARSRRTLWR